MEYAEARLSGPQVRGCGKEQRLVWTGAGQQQPYAPGVAQHHGAHRRWQRRVRPQLVVVVQILVSQRQAENPLPEHRPGRVPATGLAAWIVQNPRRLLGQSQHQIRLPQQHRAAVGSDRAAGKTGFHLAYFTAWKTNKLWGKRSVLRGWRVVGWRFSPFRRVHGKGCVWAADLVVGVSG